MFSYEDSRRNSPKEIKEEENQCFLKGICFVAYPFKFSNHVYSLNSTAMRYR